MHRGKIGSGLKKQDQDGNKSFSEGKVFDQDNKINETTNYSGDFQHYDTKISKKQRTLLKSDNKTITPTISSMPASVTLRDDSPFQTYHKTKRTGVSASTKDVQSYHNQHGKLGSHWNDSPSSSKHSSAPSTPKYSTTTSTSKHPSKSSPKHPSSPEGPFALFRSPEKRSIAKQQSRLLPKNGNLYDTARTYDDRSISGQSSTKQRNHHQQNAEHDLFELTKTDPSPSRHSRKNSQGRQHREFDDNNFDDDLETLAAADQPLRRTGPSQQGRRQPIHQQIHPHYRPARTSRSSIQASPRRQEHRHLDTQQIDTQRRPRSRSSSPENSQFRRLHHSRGKGLSETNQPPSPPPKFDTHFFDRTLSKNDSKLILPKSHKSTTSNNKLLVPQKQPTHTATPGNDTSRSATDNSIQTTNRTGQNLPNSTTKHGNGKTLRLSTIKKTDELLLPEKQQTKKMELLASLTSQPTLGNDSSSRDIIDDDKVECPYCHTILDLNLSNTVALAYEEIKHKENQFLEKQQATADSILNSLLDPTALPTHHDLSTSKRRLRRPVSNMEQFEFCNLHNIELVVKPLGDQHNWPSVIIFDELFDRMLRFKHEIDMVIAKKLDSSYRTVALEVYKDMGRHKARSTMGMMNRFETVLPGYYGTKGAAVIQEHLAALYLHHGKLGRDIVAPQTPMEYLQQVLIPEVGFRLIREDLVNGDRSKQDDPDIDDQAKRIMAESAAYGSSLHPVDWNDTLSADENTDDDDDDVVILDDDDDFYGNIGGDHGGRNGTQDKLKTPVVQTHHILDDDTTEDEDDRILDQPKKPEIYDLCDD